MAAAVARAGRAASKRRGMVIILSDCFDQIDPLMKALQHLRHRKHEVLLLHVLAPEEIEFPFKRLTQFRNLESREQKLLVDPAGCARTTWRTSNASATICGSRPAGCRSTTTCSGPTSRSTGPWAFTCRRQRTV